MNKKIWMAVLTACMLVASPLTAFAQVDGGTEGQAEPAADTPETTESLPDTALTEEGNATLGDTATSSDDKEFITVQTKKGTTYYIVIDHQRDSNNVYFLNAVDDSDLASFVDEETTSSVVGLPSTDKVDATADTSDTVTKPDTDRTTDEADAKEDESTQKQVLANSGNRNIMIIGIAAIVLLVVVILKKKKKSDHSDYETEDEYEGEEELEEETEDETEFYAEDDFPDAESEEDEITEEQESEVYEHEEDTQTEAMLQPEDEDHGDIEAESLEAQAEPDESTSRQFVAKSEGKEQKPRRKRSKRAYRIYLEPDDFEDEEK